MTDESTCPGVASKLARCSVVLAKALEKENEEWSPEAPPPVVLLGTLGRALAQEDGNVSLQELDAVSAVLEDALRNGTESDRNAVATGFLEAVVSVADTAPRALGLVGRLGRLAREYCEAWDSFCVTRTRGL